MSAFTRKDTSFLGDWWWTVDRWTLAAAALLVLVGVMLIFAASPAVAEGRNYPPYHFVQRHLVFLPFAAAALILTSMLSVRGIRRLAITIFGFAIFLMILTVAIGPETKGAQRWLNFAGISIQPSEFIKPSFAILAGWLFSKAKTDGYTLDRIVAIILFVMVISLLLLQPDFGMTVVVSVVWFTQFFLAGLPVVWVLLFIIAGLIGAIGDTNKSNGVLELGAISYPNYTDLTNPIFTLNMTDLDLANSSTLTVSDVFMDGGTLSGSTLVIA